MPLFGSAHYAAILGEIIQAHKQGKQLIYIHNAYQRAKRGTKAIATINGTTHDVWFWWSTLPHNSIVAINQPASSGWGVHNQHNILYIGRQDQHQSPIIAWITYKAAKKEKDGGFNKPNHAPGGAESEPPTRNERGMLPL